MGRKNPDEEKNIKAARKQARDEEKTENRINKVNKDKTLTAEEKLRKLLED